MPPHVEWKSFDALEASLRDLEHQYAESVADRRTIRAAVIRAKDRARFASRNSKITPEKRAEKEEMVRWMLVWLDDPSLFPEWVSLRRQQMHKRAAPDHGNPAIL